MTKSKEDINKEALDEGESPEEESSEYQHIDEFVQTLDAAELKYLKQCIEERQKSESEEEQDSNAESKESEMSGDKEGGQDKMLSANDFEQE